MDNKRACRIGYLDIAKGIGILLVVLGHAGFPFRNYIYMFHMPLFFFISGLLYNEKYSVRPLKNAKVKVKALYLPYLSYCLLFLVLHNIFVNIHLYSIDLMYGMKNFINAFIKIILLSNPEILGGALWFLICLFEITIMYSFIKFVINKIFLKNKEIILGIIITILFIVGYFTDLPLHLSISLVAIMFYYLGNLYKKYSDYIKLNIAVCIVCAISIYFMSLHTVLNFGSNKYTSIATLLISSLFGIYMTLYMSKVIEKTLISEHIKYLGMNTVPIVGLHFLAFKIVSLIQVIYYNGNINGLAAFPILHKDKWWWVLYTLVGLYVPLIIHFLFINFKNKILIFLKLNKFKVE